MKKLLKVCLLFITFLCLLCACQSKPLQEASEPGEEPAPTSSALPPRPIVAQSLGYEPAESPLMVQTYQPLHFPNEPEYTNRLLYTASHGSRLYVLASYFLEETATTYKLYQFDLNTMEIQETPFCPVIPEQESLFVESMDIIDENTLSFYITGTAANDETPSSFRYKTSVTGECLEIEDGTPDSSEHASTLTDSLPDNLPETPLAIYETSEDILYYVSPQYIVEYNTVTKSAICLASLNDCGISISSNCHLLMNDAGQLALVVLKGNTPGIYVFAEATEIQNQNTFEEHIRLTYLTFSSGADYATRMAALLSTRSSSVEIHVERADSDADMEGFRDRIMAELVAGKGPELMVVDESDLLLMAEKGLLMDISSMIPGETKAQMFSSILQLGTLEDTLYAIPQEIIYDTLFVSNQVWSEDSWTPEDVVNILENNQLADSPFLLYNRRPTANELLFKIFLGNLSESPFLDFERGICYFDSEEFVHLLELCKQYGTPSFTTLDSAERQRMLQNGEIIARSVSFYDGLSDYANAMNSRGEDFHIVGYPGTGSKVSSPSYLVVNARASQYQAIKQYITFLLSYENQYTLKNPLRWDVFENRLTKDPVTGMYYMSISLDNSMSITIQPKPDGSSYLEEYLLFLDSTVAYHNPHPAISSIIGEEFASYTDSNKTAKEAASIIQNRVQLYLDENSN